MRPEKFVCRQCETEYRLVKVSAGSLVSDASIHCLQCQAELPTREGNLVLKYFLVQQPAKTKSVKSVPVEERIGRML